MERVDWTLEMGSGMGESGIVSGKLRELALLRVKKSNKLFDVEWSMKQSISFTHNIFSFHLHPCLLYSSEPKYQHWGWMDHGAWGGDDFCGHRAIPLQQRQAPAAMCIHGCHSEHVQMWCFVPSAALHVTGGCFGNKSSLFKLPWGWMNIYLLSKISLHWKSRFSATRS